MELLAWDGSWWAVLAAAARSVCAGLLAGRVGGCPLGEAGELAAQLLPRGAGAEEPVIGPGGGADGLVDKGLAGSGDGEPDGAAVARVGFAAEKSPVFQGAHHLGGHHPVRAGERGDVLLGGRALGGCQPAGGCEQG